MQPRHRGLEPALVAAETGYMIERQLGSVAEARLYQSIAAGDVLVEVLTPATTHASPSSSEHYADFPVGGTDASRSGKNTELPEWAVQLNRLWWCGAADRALDIEGRQDTVCTWNLRKTRHSDAGWWQLLIIAIVLGLLGLADETHRLPSRS